MQVYSPRRRRRGFRFGWLLVLGVLLGGGLAIVHATADDTAPTETVGAVAGTVGTLTVVPPPVADAAWLEPAAVPVPSPVASAPGELTINLVGDVQLAEVPEALLGDDPPFGFDRVIAQVRAADLTFANLECPVSDRGAQADKQFTFRAAPSRLAALTRWGIDAVGLANNHVVDFGVAGLQDTIRHLDAAGIPHAGAGRTLADARAPVVIERNGVTVAYLAYSSIQPQGGPGGMVAPLDEAHIRADVAAAKKRAAVVIVALHMGVERPEYTDLQVRQARAALDAGATIVHGHHPHALLGFERRGGGLIAYSMGNFLFGHSGRSFRDTGLLRVTVKDGRVIAAQLMPLRDKDGPGNCYIPLLPDAANRARILAAADRLSRRFATTVADDGSILPAAE